MTDAQTDRAPFLDTSSGGDIPDAELRKAEAGEQYMNDPLSAPGEGEVVRNDDEQPDRQPAFEPGGNPTETKLDPDSGRDVVLDVHIKPETISDRIAFGFTKAMRAVADTFFAKRYGHRAVVLETVAGVPGMVGGMAQHLRSLRHMKDDEGWIRTLLDEAENERMHLMTFIEIAQPNWLERTVILIAQFGFLIGYGLLYAVHKRTAHRVIGYFEEEAVFSYTQYLAEVDAGRHPNIPAPKIAIDYWQLAPDATLRDVIIAVRADECAHRDMNHGFVDVLDGRREGIPECSGFGAQGGSQIAS